MTAHLTLDEVIRHLIAQPVAGAAHDLDVLLAQADLFLELAVHRLFGRLAVLDTPLRKLP
jgi:hypothetical protein